MHLDMVKRVQACVDVVSSDLGDGTALFDMRSSTYFNLNETAGQIWAFIAEPRTVDQIIDHITAVFEIDRPAAATDVHVLIGALGDSGLVTFDGSGGVR